MNRKGKSIEKREFHKRGTWQAKKLCCASVENELKFNLDDSAERALDSDKFSKVYPSKINILRNGHKFDGSAGYCKCTHTISPHGMIQNDVCACLLNHSEGLMSERF